MTHYTSSPSDLESIETLKQLLRRNERQIQVHLVKVCLQALDSHSLTNFTNSTVAANNLYDIYERRSTYEHLVADGFNVVLPALKERGAAQVGLYGFDTTGTAYVLFTDSLNAELLGIIAVDRVRSKPL